jgi:hypothetical protein
MTAKRGSPGAGHVEQDPPRKSKKDDAELGKVLQDPFPASARPPGLHRGRLAINPDPRRIRARPVLGRGSGKRRGPR